MDKSSNSTVVLFLLDAICMSVCLCDVTVWWGHAVFMYWAECVCVLCDVTVWWGHAVFMYWAECVCVLCDVTVWRGHAVFMYWAECVSVSSWTESCLSPSTITHYLSPLQWSRRRSCRQSCSDLPRSQSVVWPTSTDAFGMCHSVESILCVVVSVNGISFTFTVLSVCSCPVCSRQCEWNILHIHSVICVHLPVTRFSFLWHIVLSRGFNTVNKLLVWHGLNSPAVMSNLWQITSMHALRLQASYSELSLKFWVSVLWMALGNVSRPTGHALWDLSFHSKAEQRQL